MRGAAKGRVAGANGRNAPRICPSLVITRDTQVNYRRRAIHAKLA